MTAIFEGLLKKGPVLLGLIALALVALLQVADPAPLARVRMQVFDAYQNFAPREAAADQRVVVVDIDEESIEQLGQWPWPRTDLAKLTDRLGSAGAEVVVFDIVFSEVDRTSPAEAVGQLEGLSQAPQLQRELARLPSHDARLAESFGQVPVVTGYFLDNEERGRDIEPKAGFTIHGSMPSEFVQSYSGSLQPLPELESAAAGNGFVSLKSDPDGIVRRVPLVAIHRATLIPSLSLETLRIFSEAGSPNLLASDGSGESASSPGAAVAIRVDGTEIPVNDAGEMWVHFPVPNALASISAAPIISGEISDTKLAEHVGGKIVIVGGSAAGLQDLVSTPLSERIAGVTVHATAMEQMIDGHFLQRPDWAFGLELVLVLLIGVAFSLILPRLGALWGAIAGGVGIVAVIAASWLGFTQLRYLLDPTYPAVALALVYTLQTVAVYYREEQQRSYIHSAFDRFLSPELVRQIADDPSKLELGGEERDMSVLMCDIRGFSRISEQYSPREVIDFLIAFLTPMSDILLAHRATLDKYIGDAILAFWNAPLDDPDHHRNAARAALAMTAKLDELNRMPPTEGGRVWPDDVAIGIGLNSGLCCVGNMGSEQRLSYSLIGDTVNVASRFEGLTKQYGVRIIAGTDLARELPGFALLEIDRVRVVGRVHPEKIFALMGDEQAAEDPQFLKLEEAHGQMLASYRSQDWDKASAVLADSKALYASCGVPKLAEIFEARIASLSKNPPGADWDAVFTASEK